MGVQGESLWDLKNEVFSCQKDSKAQVRDLGPGQRPLCVVGVRPGVIEGFSRKTGPENGGGVCETCSEARPTLAHPLLPVWLPGTSLGQSDFHKSKGGSGQSHSLGSAVGSTRWRSGPPHLPC